MILLSNVTRIRRTPAASRDRASSIRRRRCTVQGTAFTFVLDVAVTLTVQTQQIDPVTKQYQTETKALLNVSPRNVFNAWELAGIGYTDRIQSTPATVTALLPVTSVRLTSCTRHNERGIALVLALFLMSALSVLAASLMFLSQTETYASMNYRMMSQARYAAEAGVQKAVELPARSGAVCPCPTAPPIR